MGFRTFSATRRPSRTCAKPSAPSGFPIRSSWPALSGAGKYTLALMLAKAVNCLQPTETDGLPDFCGVCRNCARIGDSANLDELVAAAVAPATTSARPTRKKPAS
jgi:DNA polymerase-3 subunit delta'